MHRGVGGGFQARRQKLRSSRRAVAPVRRVAFSAAVGACPRLDGTDRLYGARAATGSRRLVERMSVVMSWLFCDRRCSARPCGKPGRKNLVAYLFIFRICRCDFSRRRADSAAVRRADDNGMAVGVTLDT